MERKDDSYLHINLIKCAQQSKCILRIFQACCNTFPESCDRNLDRIRQDNTLVFPYHWKEYKVKIQRCIFFHEEETLKLTRLSLSLGGSWGSEAVCFGGGEGPFALGCDGDGSLIFSLIGAVSALGICFSALSFCSGGGG